MTRDSSNKMFYVKSTNMVKGRATQLEKQDANVLVTAAPLITGNISLALI